MKRFWSESAVERAGQGYTVRLDQRRLMTPAKAPLEVPSRALAEAIAAEWDAQGEQVEPQALPLTRAANSAIDRVAPQQEAVVEQIAGYAETDLLCYRAPHPEALARREAEAWDPLLAWVRERFGARLTVVEGVMHQPQTAEALAALRDAVAAEGTFHLAALHELVALSGSLVIGLGVRHHRLDAAEAWRISRIDEDWQISQWGEDAEAAAAARRREREFHQAKALLDLLD